MLNSHDAARFKIIVSPGSTIWSAICLFCEPFGADELVRDAALWAGGVDASGDKVTTTTGLLIFNDSARFFSVGGDGWNNPELNLPASWGIADLDQTFGGLTDGGYTEITALGLSISAYDNVTDIRMDENSISSFAASFSDQSFHSIFGAFDPTIFTPTEILRDTSIPDPGGHTFALFGLPFGWGAPAGPTESAISLIREEESGPSNSPPTIVCELDEVVVDCALPGGESVTLSADVEDADGDELTVEWEIDSVVVETDTVPAGSPLTTVEYTDTFGFGSEVVTVTVSDGMDEAECSTEVTVNPDETPPSLSLPAPITLECQGPDGVLATDGAIVAWLASASVSDACEGPVTLSNDAPAAFPTGAVGDPGTDVTFTATDESGNTTVLSSSVSVEDTTPPELTVPAPITLQCKGAGGILATDPDVLAWLSGVSATDVCSLVTVSNDLPETLPLNCGPGSGTVVTFTAVDDWGNETILTSEISVVDSEPPVIECNAYDIASNDTPVSFTATAADECGTAILSIPSFECFKINKNGKVVDKSGSCVVSTSGGTLTVIDGGGVGNTIKWTVTATDECGNTATEECQIEILNPGNGGDNCNEGVDNGVDCDTPGHDNNGQNDDPGNGPGSPGAKNKNN